MGGDVCRLLSEAIQDEDKAPEEYIKLRDQLTDKKDINAVNKIIKDENRHARRLRKLSLKLNCPL